jgi:hypothetical protein
LFSVATAIVKENSPLILDATVCAVDALAGRAK